MEKTFKVTNVSWSESQKVASLVEVVPDEEGRASGNSIRLVYAPSDTDYDAIMPGAVVSVTFTVQ